MARRRATPQRIAEQHAISATDQTAMLDAKYINSTKGRGVFARSPFQMGDFVVEYRGDMIDFMESERRRRIYHPQSSVFMFDFKWHGKKWCIDAAFEDDSLGRLVNDDHVHPTCRMKRIIAGGKPHLCLFAARDINRGEEITYDYGNGNWPWREKCGGGDSPVMAKLLDKTIEMESVDILGHGSETLHTDGEDRLVGETPKMEQEQEGKETLNAELEEKPGHSSDWVVAVVEEKEEEKDEQACAMAQSLGEESEESEVEQATKKMVRKESIKDWETQSETKEISQKLEDTELRDQNATNSSATSLAPTTERKQCCDHMADQNQALSCTPPNEIGKSSYDQTDASAKGCSGDLPKVAKLVNYTDSDESADDDVPSPTKQIEDLKSKEKISVGPNLSDSSIKHGDDVQEMIVPKLRRTKSIFMTKNPDGSFDPCGDELFCTSPDNGEEYVPVSNEESTDDTDAENPEGSFDPCDDERFGTSSDSGEEYVPVSNEESTDDTDGSMICEISPSMPRSFLSAKTLSNRSSSTPCQSSATNVCVPDSTCSPSREHGESASVSVPAVRKKEDGSRMYNKRQFCLYCQSSFLKIAKHLERKHNKEPEVQKLLIFPKGSKKRRAHLEYLRNKGNFAHNAEVMRTGKGELVARKQPRKESQAQKYTPCIYCQGWFLKHAMWRHMRICKFKPVNPKPGKTRVQALCAFAEPIPDGVSENLWKLVSSMNQDAVAHAVRSDWCIMEMGKHLYNKHGFEVDKHEFIRQKLRELGRLRICGGEVTNMKTIREYVIPANFMQTVTAVKHTAQGKKGNITWLPMKLGHSLKRLSMLLESDAIIKGDKDAIEELRSFRNLYDAKWHELVSVTSLKSLKESKWNAPQLLPFTADVQKLHNYLDEKQQQYQHDLKSEASSQNWANLAKVTLAQVILFNRRREGEVSKMPLSAYTSRDTSAPHEDVNLALSELEKKLCHYFIRVEMRGKRGRKVAVLLSPSMQEALDMLHQKRKECGVLKENTYVFARPGAMTHYRGSDCIRQFVQCCDVKNPLSLTSTKLRKHVATLSKVLNLQETELDQLADFMGHDIRVHRQFYRLPEGTIQLVKISKILMAMEQGRLADFQGKSLEEINIDPNETIQLDMHTESEEVVHDMEVPDVSPAQKQKQSGLPQEEIHSDEEDLPVRKTKSTTVVPGVSPPQKRRRSGLSPANEQESRSDGDDICVQKKKSKTSHKPQKKRPWQTEEITAVEKHMRNFILTCKVPRKEDCDKCLKSEPEALKNRDWKALKFYIKNRITALKRM